MSELLECDHSGALDRIGLLSDQLAADRAAHAQNLVTAAGSAQCIRAVLKDEVLNLSEAQLTQLDQRLSMEPPTQDNALLKVRLSH